MKRPHGPRRDEIPHAYRTPQRTNGSCLLMMPLEGTGTIAPPYSADSRYWHAAFALVTDSKLGMCLSCFSPVTGRPGGDAGPHDICNREIRTLEFPRIAMLLWDQRKHSLRRT